MAERIISQGSQLAIFIAAARILSPAEFGIFALVSTCAILLLRVAEVGWAPYIMSWAGDARVPRQVVMVSLFSGVLMGAVGVLGGLLLPLFGPSAATGHLVMLFSLWVLLATVSSAQKGMMIWLDGLRASSLAEILGDLVGMAVALTTLFAGWGVFALAFGRLAFQSTHLALSFAFTRLSPLPGLRGEELRDLARYSGQIFSSRMIANLRLYVATFLVGGFLGPASVGYFRAGSRLVGSAGEIIGQPTQVVAWSIFRRARDSGATPQAYQRQAAQFFTVIFAIGTPVFIWMTLMGEDLITGLLGAKWLPALPIVAALSLARAVGMHGPATEPLLSLAGEIRRLPLYTLFFLVLTVLITLVGTPFGLLAVAWSQVAVAVIIAAMTVRLQARFGGVDWGLVMRSARRLLGPIVIGTAVILALRESAAFDALPPLVRAFGVVPPALVAYVAALMVVMPGWRRQAIARLGRRKRGGPSPVAPEPARDSTRAGVVSTSATIPPRERCAEDC